MLLPNQLRLFDLSVLGGVNIVGESEPADVMANAGLEVRELAEATLGVVGMAVREPAEAALGVLGMAARELEDATLGVILPVGVVGREVQS